MMIITRVSSVLTAALLVSGCAAPRVAQPEVERLAQAYVKLQLAIGEHEEGYIDAYYGPQEWAEAARSKRPVAELKTEAESLIAQTSRLRGDAATLTRRRYLAAHLHAALARVRFMQGERLAFREEAKEFFDIRPELQPLASYDDALRRLEALLPGAGPLSERAQEFRRQYVIPKDKIEAAMRAAIAECRRRTVAQIDLPSGEAFDLELVTGQPWSGYNGYKGNARSIIKINVDLPFFIDRALDLGCHEGYPGHHVYSTLLDSKFAQGRDWVEYSVYATYTPTSLISEGSATYGVEVAFPGDERDRFESDVLYPLAGLDPATATRYSAYRRAAEELSGAYMTIAAEYLDGRIGRDAALQALEIYQLYSRAQAERSLRFVEKYRSYVINYGLGRDVVRAYIEREGGDAVARWNRLEQLLTAPILPSDLVDGDARREN